MRGFNSQRPWHPRFKTLILSSFLLFLVFPESRARGVFLTKTGGDTISADEPSFRDVQTAGVQTEGIQTEGVRTEGVQTEGEPPQKVDINLSERIKTEAGDLPEKIPEGNKGREDQGKTSGIRRFDSDVPPEPEKIKESVLDSKGIHIGSETHVEVSEVKVNLPEREDQQKGIIETDEELGEKFKRARAEEDQGNIKKKVIINSDGLGKLENPEQETPVPESAKVSYTIIELLKQQAMLLQEKIRDKTLFETLKEPTLVIPEVPLLIEEDILDSLKSLSSTKKHHDLNIEPFSHDLLSDKQLQIVQCSAAIIADQQRQTFISSMYDCVRNLSVMNCMRIFVYPIIAETVPQLIIQNIPGLPIEITVSDLLPNRNKTKSARSAAFLLYPLLNGEEIVISMLKDALDTHRSYENIPSYIDPMNETFVKMLTPGQLRILQMAEKLLPVTARQEYSDRMYSCVKRFEYYSCLRYFAWPMMKKYYPGLSDFPEYLIVYPTYTPYPVVPFPLEPGQLPEVVEADLKEKTDTLILRILKEGIKPLKGQPVNLSNKQTLEEIRRTVAKQALPQLRAEFASQSLKCIREVDYYACMKYYTWPILRQAPFPQFPDLSGFFQFPDFSQFFQFPDLSGLFQLPDFSGFAPPAFPMIPGFPGLPTVPTIPTIPGAPSIPTIPGPPSIPIVPGAGGIPTIPGAGGIPTIPGAGSIPTIPGAGGIPTVPEAGSIPTIPGAGGIPTIPGAGSIPTIPGAPSIPTIPGGIPTIPGGIPTIPGAGGIPTIPGAGSIPTIPGAEGIPTIPGAGSIPEVGSIPGAGGIPTIPGAGSIPGVGSIPGIGSIPGAGGIPTIPGAGSIPTIPEVPSVPIPGAGGIPTLPGLPTVPTTPEPSVTTNPEPPNTEAPPVVIRSESRHGQLERNVEPQVSLRSEITSNVPVISITGNEFVPILSEKPESVIFTILRLYQISDPSLVNTLAIPFLNSSTPEYSFLNLHQENTILLAKSMLPESARSSFSEQMISCSRDKDFLRCSKEIMFPTLSEYFPNLPSFPNFVDDVKEVNSTDPKTLISETKVKHGEATLTITDTRFIPIFSEHPEGVVMNILRALQLSSNLPPGLLRTKEIIQSLGVQDLSEKQILILEVGESLLPGEERENFVKRMVECSRKLEFLDCSRDIAFPTIAQYHPNLPSFPNFGTQGLRSQIQDFQKTEVENYYQQIEDHLQNEIENILMRTSVNERSINQDPRDIQIPGFLSKQQRNIMRLSDNILPESVRPAYHATMMDCMQSSSFVTCMQNVGWPLLRLNPLLLEPPPKLPDSTSQVLPASPIPLEPEHQKPTLQMYPDLPVVEGQRLDITPSVDRQTSLPEIPAYPGQPFAPFVDLSTERVDPNTSIPPEDIKPETEMKSLSRRKRSPDLLDSYPENDPDESKGSVRKNLSNSPNMTESELLQLLINLKNSNNDQFRNTQQKYFIDNLDPELKSTLTPNQVQILKLFEELNPESSRGIMAQLWQCIRSLSLIRCAGVFILPMITSNLPSLAPFSGRSQSTVQSTVEEFFGMPPNDFEKELMMKKQQFEDVLLTWYKNLLEQKFETSIGFLRVKGHGNGELGLSLSGFREGRAKIIKDNKNLPSILTIISEIMEDVLESKPKSDKNKKDPKKGKSIRFEENNHQFLRDSTEDSRSMKDDRILAALLEKMKNIPHENNSETRNDYYFSIEDAYKAFEVLFGTRFTSEIGSRIKSFSQDHFRSFINRNRGSTTKMNEDDEDDELKIVPLEAQKKVLEEKLKIVPLFHYYDLDHLGNDKKLAKEQSKILRDQNGSFTRKKKHQTELSIQLPRLDDLVFNRKLTSIVNMGRGLKDKMMQMMPGVGLVISFLLQMGLAHARTAASVAGMMSNMALGMGLFSMVRDALFGQPNHPKVKYVYDTESVDPGVSWPKEPSYWQ